MSDNSTFFPAQKLPTSKKTKEWYKKNIDAAESLSLLRVDGGLEAHRKMQVWEDLDNDIIDVAEIEKVFNPMGLKSSEFPSSIKNYPLSVPKIDLLQGEELKKKFDWALTAKNEESHSAYSKAIKDDMLSLATQYIMADSFNEEDFQKKLQGILKYYKYDFKDLNEVAGTRVLQYLWRQQDLKDKFSKGFRNALVKGREIFRVDIIGGEPSVVIVDPINIYSYRRGDSERIEDSDVILQIEYEPVGKVIDEFHEYLTPGEVDELENGYNTAKGGGILGYQSSAPQLFASTHLGPGTIDPNIQVNSMNAYNLPYDYEGNIRVIRARWMGRRKIGKLKYFDEETGEQLERLVSEKYEPREEFGESVKWIWINEAYEGTKLGKDIYVKCQPREIQMRHFDNPSKCFLGYVGTDFGKSLMGRMEPLQYLYNVYMRRLELAIAKYHGPIYELDISKVPDGWELDMWFYYAEILGWAVIDPMNEGKKGAATGKITGNFNTTGKVLDSNIGNYVQQLVSMLQYIEMQIGKISGVTDQRLGQVDNRETVGGIERAVSQSSHITEKWFFVHDETKKRVMLALLDTAKHAWRFGKSKKLSFIMGDMSRAVIDVNSEDFASTEYDLFVTNSSEDLEIRQTLKQLAQSAMQNGASITLPITILRSDSITEMAKQLQEEEENRMNRQEEMSKKQLESNERIQIATLEDKEAERELEYYKIDKQAETQLMVASMKQTGETAPEEDDSEKLNLERKKHEDEIRLKKEQLVETKRHNIKTENKPAGKGK